MQEVVMAMRAYRSSMAPFNAPPPSRGGVGGAGVRDWWLNVKVTGNRRAPIWLAQLANVLLDVVPHSAANERLFSALGFLTDKRRHGLKLETLQQMQAVQMHYQSLVPTIDQKGPQRKKPKGGAAGAGKAPSSGGASTAAATAAATRAAAAAMVAAGARAAGGGGADAAVAAEARDAHDADAWPDASDDDGAVASGSDADGEDAFDAEGRVDDDADVDELMRALEAQHGTDVHSAQAEEAAAAAVPAELLVGVSGGTWLAPQAFVPPSPPETAQALAEMLSTTWPSVDAASVVFANDYVPPPAPVTANNTIGSFSSEGVDVAGFFSQPGLFK
ncbi:unnamed protein product [Phaeothamnion confervicola]